MYPSYPFVLLQAKMANEATKYKILSDPQNQPVDSQVFQNRSQKRLASKA